MTVGLEHSELAHIAAPHLDAIKIALDGQHEALFGRPAKPALPEALRREALVVAVAAERIAKGTRMSVEDHRRLLRAVNALNGAVAHSVPE